MKHKRNYGITLISLVITIIVLLILAGVSLNLVVGDNGIIKRAAAATIEQKRAALEEYLQDYYVKNYDYFSASDNRIMGLRSLRESKDWIYAGKFGYVLDSKGYVHYYLNCDNLNDDMKAIIGTWKNKTFLDYVKGNGCWGVTNDLKVYYTESQSDGTIKYYGNVSEDSFSKERGDLIIFSNASGYTDAIKGEEYSGNINLADTRNTTQLAIDETNGITNFNELYNFVALEKLVMSNLKDFESFDGIEYCVNVKDIFIQNCTVNDYKALAQLPKLEKLYIYNADDNEMEKLFSSDRGIGGKDIPTLKHLGIYGKQNFTFLYHYDDVDKTTADKSVHSDFTKVEYLSNLSQVTKNSISYLFLNNNKITDISNLWEFPNLTLLRLENNYLESLDGLYNSSQNQGCTKLEKLFVRQNLLGIIEDDLLDPGTDSLTVLSKANGSNGNYTFSKIFTNLSVLDLANSTYLKHIEYISTLDTLTRLYLDGCTSLLESAVLKAAPVISGAVTSIPDNYEYYLALNDDTITELSLKDREITLSDFDSILKNKSSLVKLLLEDVKFVDSSGTEITNYNTEVNATLEKLTKLRYVSLKGLGGLTSVSFIKKTPELKQVDLRGTNVVDMQDIIDYGLSLVCLAIDNENIDTTTLQGVWDRCCTNYNSKDPYALFDIYDNGLFLANPTLIAQVKDWTEITKLPGGHDNAKINAQGCTWDFRGCTKLTSFNHKSATPGDVYLPTTIEKLSIWGAGANYKVLNLESLTNCTYYYNSTTKHLAEDANKLINLQELDHYFADEKFYLSELTNPEKYKKIAIYSFAGSQSKSAIDANLVGLERFVNLEDFRVYFAKRVTKIPEGIESCTKLKRLVMYNTNVASLHPVRNLENLEYIDVHDTALYETGFYQYDNGTVVNCDNMGILADLNSRKLDTLYIYNTNIEDFSSISKLKWKTFQTVK